MKIPPWLTVVIATILHSFVICAAAASDKDTISDRTFVMPAKTEGLLNQYCYTCHDGDSQKGDIRLDNLSKLDNSKRLEMLNRMQEQVFFQNMPPKQKKQPNEAERKELLSFISTELRAHHASTLEDKLQKPEFGN